MTFLFVVNPQNPLSARRATWRKIVVRRNKCVRLVEELNLRYGRLQPLYAQMSEINDRMQELKQQLDEIASGNNERFHNEEEIRAELNHLMMQTFETPATLKRRIIKTNRLQQVQDALPSVFCRLVI